MGVWEFRMGVGIFLRWGGKRVKRLCESLCMIGENYREGHLKCLKGPGGDCGKLPGIYAGFRRGSWLAPIQYILKDLWLKQNRGMGHVDPQAATLWILWLSPWLLYKRDINFWLELLDRDQRKDGYTWNFMLQCLLEPCQQIRCRFYGNRNQALLH